MFMPYGGGALPLCSRVLRREYTGDDTNDREIDLGDDYDVVEIRITAGVAAAQHLVLAKAVRDAYYWRRENVGSASPAIADDYFQGKLTGADATKIKLGADGANAEGTNVAGLTYEIFAWKMPDA